MGLVTTLKQFSRRSAVGATVAAGACLSFACGVRIHEAVDLQNRHWRLLGFTEDVLGECGSEHTELSAERDELLRKVNELNGRQDSNYDVYSDKATLNHIVDPWPLRYQTYFVWSLQARAVELFLKTSDPKYSGNSGTDVADKIPEHYWRDKAGKTRFFLKHLPFATLWPWKRRAADPEARPEACPGP